MRLNSSAYSFGRGGRSKLEKVESKEIPGPGHYYSNKIESGSNTQGAIIGKSERKGIEGHIQDIPGPSDYDSISSLKYIRQKHCGVRMTKPPEVHSQTSKSIEGSPPNKGSTQHLNKSPGPGSYEPYMGKSVKDVSMAKSQRKGMAKEEPTASDKKGTQISQTPGPGAYSLELSANKVCFLGGSGSHTGQQISFTKGERLINQEIERNSRNPGPQSYFQNFHEKKYLKNHRTFNIERKIVDRGSTPGPGEYVIYTDVDKITKKNQKSNELRHSSKSLGKNTSSINTSNIEYSSSAVKKEKLKFLGPWTYNLNPELIKNTKGAVFGKAQRKSDLNSTVETPGPEYYPKVEVAKRGGRACTFNRGNTRENIKSVSQLRTEMPGPGAYSILSFVDQSTMESNKRPKSQAGVKASVSKYIKYENPGPTNYNPMINQITKSPSIGGKIGTAIRNQTLINKSMLDSPSPGQYYTEQIQGSSKYNQLTFASAKRKDFTQAEGDGFVPGPGAYKIPTTFGNLPHYEAHRKNQSQFL